MQKKIIESKKVFNSNGEITFGGWSRFPLFEYNKQDYPQKSKLTEKDCYFVTNSEVSLYLSVETSGMDLSIRIVLTDLKTGEITGDSVVKHFLLDMPVLPESGSLGEFAYKDKKIALSLTNTVDGRYIKCDFIDFDNYKNLFVKILVKKADGESMNTIAPFDGAPKCFYLKRFVPKFTASGVIRFGGTDYTLDDSSSTVYFDWSRYTLPRKQKVQYLSGIGKIGESRFAINLASRIGNNAKGSENCYFIGEKLYKFGRIAVSGDENDATGEWRFTTPDNSAELIFTPLTNEGIPLACKCDRMNIVFGTVNGMLSNDDGRYEIVNFVAHMIFAQI